MSETIHRLKSQFLGNERTIWIREPGDRAQARNLMIFLDAEIYRDWVWVPAMLDSLSSSLADSWFVFVSMESPEARWKECPLYPPFVRFIVEELLPWLAQHGLATSAMNRRVLVGLSYTGLAAAYVALQAPGVFTAVISQSGSFWYDDCRIALEVAREAGKPLADFYLDVGTQEIRENVQHRPDVLQTVSQVEGVRRFREVLLERGAAVTYVEFVGGHDAAGWRKSLPAALLGALGGGAPDSKGSDVRPG